jgi:hypothetical protein
MSISGKQLLQAAVGAHYSDEAQRDWHTLAPQAGPTIWRQAAGLALQLGLAPLLYQTIRRQPPQQLPDELKRALEASYYQAGTHNMLALAELGSILEVLAHRSVDVCLLKGAALVLTVYKEPALRPMVDLDLLVPFQQVGSAQEALTGLGYTLKQPPPFVDKSGLFWNQALMVKPGLGNMAVELHWSLIDIPHYARAFPAEAFLERAFLIEQEGFTALAPALVDQVLHLCGHQFYHHPGGLGRTGADLGFILSSGVADVPWPKLLALARESDLVLAAKAVLSEAAGEWYAPIPPEIIGQLGTWRPRVRERLFVRAQANEFLKLLRTFLTLPGAGEKLGFLRGQLFPSRAYLAWRYGLAPEAPLVVGYASRLASGLRGLLPTSRRDLAKPEGEEKGPDG